MFGANSCTETLANYIKAGRNDCPAHVLEELSHSSVDRIRLRVAENIKTPPEVLELLASDRNAEVRIAVGVNPSTPAHISFSLAFDDDPNVRLGLAEDMNTPLELLEKLIEDHNPYVSCRAARTREYILARGLATDIGQRRFVRSARKGGDGSELKYA